jgi:hypothetical protein
VRSSPRADRVQALQLAAALPEPSPALARTPPERCTAQDRFHDYILADYSPVASPVGKLRALNVLVESFALEGLEDQGRAVLDAVRGALGPFRTVWGIKRRRHDERLGWELYFYDFERRHADLSIANVARILEPLFSIAAPEPRALPWHMFSIEFGRDQLVAHAPAPVDVYLDMRSYKLTNQGPVFENVYTFHETRREIEVILERMRACLHFDPRVDGLHHLLPPHLFQCAKLCVAHKRGCDALYFSRITTRALARFLRDQGWPEALVEFVRSREGDLNHLLWDAGIDFASVEGRATVLKSGIYGTF